MKAVRLIFCFLLGFILHTSSAHAQRWQWPEKFQNLQVFPDSTTTRQLRAKMGEFAGALGVRCSHCHVGEGNQPLSTYDFAADTKQTKQTARLMLQMTESINQQFVSQVNTTGAHRLQVNCITCHKQQARPLTLEQVLTDLINTAGADSAIARYHQLRNRYYGGFTYDFSQVSLNNLGYQLMGNSDLENAVKIFSLNVEMNPDHSNPYDSLAEAYMNAGNKELAIANYKKSLELNPDNRNAKQMLEKLAQE